MVGEVGAREVGAVGDLVGEVVGRLVGGVGCLVGKLVGDQENRAPLLLRAPGLVLYLLASQGETLLALVCLHKSTPTDATRSQLKPDVIRIPDSTFG